MLRRSGEGEKGRCKERGGGIYFLNETNACERNCNPTTAMVDYTFSFYRKCFFMFDNLL
jgi:hypothetical protein